MQNLKHKYILEQIDFNRDIYQKYIDDQLYQSKEKDYVVLKLAERGCLCNIIGESGRFSEPVARYYMKQMLDGLDYCHFSGITHRDLKADNLLIDQNYDLKIADFGFAGPSSGNNGSGLLRSQVGTRRYMAPEIMTSTKGYRGPPVDLFAVGVILFIMVTARFPFAQADPSKDRLFYAIQFGDTKFFWNHHDQNNGSGDLSSEIKDLITCLLQAKPLHRPAICEVLAQPWFNGTLPTHDEISAEFKERDRLVKERLRQQRTERKKLKEATVNAMNAESSNHRSGREPPQKPIRPHVETGNAKTSFFSRLSPDMIEEALVNYLNQRSITAKQRPRKYQIDFSYLSPNASAVMADMTEGWQQSEEVQVRVKISQVVNGDTFTEGPTYCVEFSRMAGDTLDFNQAYNIFFQEALSFAIEDI